MKIIIMNWHRRILQRWKSPEFRTFCPSILRENFWTNSLAYLGWKSWVKCRFELGRWTSRSLCPFTGRRRFQTCGILTRLIAQWCKCRLEWRKKRKRYVLFRLQPHHLVAILIFSARFLVERTWVIYWVLSNVTSVQTNNFLKNTLFNGIGTVIVKIRTLIIQFEFGRVYITWPFAI